MRMQLHLAATRGYTKTILGGLLFSWLCVGAHAATISTTISINGSGSISTSTGSVTATGTVTFAGGLTANGTFGATAGASSLTTGSIPITLTITSGSTTGTLTGTFTASPLLLEQILLATSAVSGTGSIAITGGTGGFAGATGTFTNVTAAGTGSGNSGSGTGTFSIAGPGTLTYSGTTGPPAPTVTGVLDAASNSATLAQGTIFIVKGTALCSVTALTAYSVPRPTVGSDGVTITFTPTAGTGSPTNALIWYEDPLSGGACQLAGILPSSVATGNYNVTVTNKTASAPVAVTVVQSKFALFTQDSTGGGLAVAQNVVSATEYDLNRLTTGSLNGVTISPAHPSQYMVVYGTGLGGVAGDDNAASPVYDFTKNGVSVNVIIGGVTVPALFAGRAGYAGEDQVNFQLPANVPTGCTETFQVSVNGSLSPATTISVAPAGASACVLPGYTTSQLQSLDNGGTITAGGVDLSQLTINEATIGSITSASASASFTQISGFELASLSSLPGSFSQTTIGSCTVYQATVGSNGQVVVSGTATILDAGTVTLSGPAASNLNNTPMTDTAGSYSLTIGESGSISIPGEPSGTLGAGTYTVAATGGTGVGKFNASITLGSPLSVTGGLPATVNRSSPLTINWTGGASADVVAIIGYSGTTTGTGTSAVSTVTEFTCTTTAGTGGFTVPTSVLGQLQATPASSAGGTGFLEVSSGPAPVSFAPTLTGSSTTVASTFSASVGTAGLVTYQ